MEKLKQFWLLFFIFEVRLELILAANFSIRNFVLVNHVERPDENITESYFQCLSGQNDPTKLALVQGFPNIKGHVTVDFTKFLRHDAPIYGMELKMVRDAFGVYKCVETVGTETFSISALKLADPLKEEIHSEVSQIVAVKGQDVNITMKDRLADPLLAILWRHNGNNITDWQGKLQVTINSVNSSHQGIYECFYEEKDTWKLHAIVRLIIVECPLGMFGPSCESQCIPCYNGGVCDGRTGVCICPPGFGGSNCQKACDAAHFGENCDKACESDDCTRITFCYVDPLGCTCAAGLKGLKCNEVCESGTYGAGCTEVCHCNGTCDAINGKCLNGSSCHKDWQGESCQAPVCSAGSFGPNCNYACHCKNGFNNCDPLTGDCSEGCEPGYTGPSCQEGLFNPNLMMTRQLQSNSTGAVLDRTCVGGYLPREIQFHDLIQVLGVAGELNSQEKNDDFGYYFCDETVNGISTRVLDVSAKLNHSEITDSFTKIYTTVGDSVMLEMNPIENSSQVEWMHNNVVIPDWEDRLVVTIPKVQKSDAGFYEAFIKGRREQKQHRFIQLIVSACPSGRFGSSCEEFCEPCYNGGVCHDSGLCICPHGFSGSSCEKACEENRFGNSCTETCDDFPSSKGSCAGMHFCYPEPLACTCAAGFKGQDCSTPCDQGTFGADCTQVCHCRHGHASCNQVNGVCKGGCEDGWTGESCQIKICEPGYFGPNCSGECHCLKGPQFCRNTTGRCDGPCEPGFKGLHCQQKCPSGFFGLHCNQICHCKDGHSSCNHMNGSCDGECQLGYQGDNCQHAEMDLFLTMQSAFDKIRDGANSLIQCTPTRNNPEDIIFGRDLNTGQGINLTTNSVFGPNPNNSSLMILPEADGAERFGVYFCEETVGDVVTKITTLKLPFDDKAEIIPVEQYLLAKTGDEIVITMKAAKNQSLSIQWRFNGEEKPEWTDQLEITIKDVNKDHEGIYECYYEGRQHLGLHALTKLTVKRCRDNKWGELCDKQCPDCFNGGVCQEDIGQCICSPGFSGANCLKPCGGNTFGVDCERRCDYNNLDDDDGCAVALMCLPDPYGCKCASGFTGPQCMEECDPGNFGAGCTETCHCKDGPDDCDRITGTCGKGCAFGWTGETCQIPDNSSSAHLCPIQKFGLGCEQECHCSGNEPCDVLTGKCPGECADGWAKESCSECSLGRFGDTCKNICHCINGPKACNGSSGECKGDCEPGYVGVNCQEECPPQTYGLNCSYTCSCQHKGRCDPFNGTCECTGKWRGENCTEVAPEIISAPDIEVNAGIQANISCLVMANPQPQIQIWSPGLPDFVTDINAENETTYSAKVSYVSDNAATYKLNCTAHNDHNTAEAIITLQIIEPPTLSKAPEILQVAETTASLSWNSWSYGSDKGGKPNDVVEYKVYVWLEDDLEWAEAGDWRETTGAKVTRLSPDTNYKFAIKSRRSGEGGEGNLSPNVSSKTSCAKADQDQVFPDDFRTKEVTNSHIHIIWTKPAHDDLRCSLKDYQIRIWPEADSSNVKEVKLRASLTEYVITNVDSETRYIIEMTVSTLLGNAGKPATLDVTTQKAVVGPVENLQFSYGTLPHQVNLQWQEPKDKKTDIKKYLVSAKLVNIGQCGKKFGGFNITNVETTDMQATVANLQPYSEYEITVQAQTPIGQGEVSLVSVKTKEDAPTAPPANVRTETVEKTRIQFVWDPVPCDKANGIIITYEYSVKEVKERSKRSDQWLIQSVPINDTSVNINGLTPYGKYGFSVRALTKEGPGPLSEELVLRTEDDIPPSPEMKIIGASPTTLTVQITKSRRPHSAILHYRLQCSYSTNDTQTVTLNVTDDSQPIEYTITGLSAYTPYTLQVVAETKVNWSEPCEPQIAWTQETVPSPPRDFHLDSATKTELRISWNPPEKMNGLLNGYTVIYRLMNTTQRDELVESSQRYMKFPMVNSSSSMTLTDLVPESEYEVSITAHNRIGDSLEVKRIFKTLGEENIVPKSDFIEPPLPPTIHKSKKNTIHITIHQASNDPRAYQVIVEDSNNNEIIEPDYLSDSETARKQGRGYYIAAEIEADKVPADGYYFQVGDDQIYDKYHNTPLDPNKKYLINVRTVHGDGSVFSPLSENNAPIEVKGESAPISPTFEVIEEEDNKIYIWILRNKEEEQPKAYQVIIEDEANTDVIDPSKLANYSIADNMGHPYYIAAEIDAEDVNDDGYRLLVGDDEHYGEFHNAPLQEDKKYRYHVRTVQADGRSFSPLSSPLKEKVGETQSKKECYIWDMACQWFLLLVVGLVVLVLLILAATVFCTRRRRRSRSHRISQREKGESTNESIIRRTSKSQMSSSRTYTASYRLSKVEVDAQNGTVTNEVKQEKCKHFDFF